MTSLDTSVTEKVGSRDYAELSQLIRNAGLLQRRYGYYVLPFLRGDRIVGRADLKSERAEGRLVLKAFHPEDGVRASGALDDALDRALERLARTIGLGEVRR